MCVTKHNDSRQISDVCNEAYDSLLAAEVATGVPIIFLVDLYEGIFVVVELHGFISGMHVDGAAGDAVKAIRTTSDGHRRRPILIVEGVGHITLNGDGAIVRESELTNAGHRGGRIIGHVQQSADAAAGSDNFAIVIANLKVGGIDLSFADSLLGWKKCAGEVGVGATSVDW